MGASADREHHRAGVRPLSGRDQQMGARRLPVGTAVVDAEGAVVVAAQEVVEAEDEAPLHGLGLVGRDGELERQLGPRRHLHRLADRSTDLPRRDGGAGSGEQDEQEQERTQRGTRGVDGVQNGLPTWPWRPS